MFDIHSFEFLYDFPEDWLAAMSRFLNFRSLSALDVFLRDEYGSQTVFPPRQLLFRAFQATPFQQVRAVILGQDPYHEKGQACGLSFSVPAGTEAPASLKNILKEYAADLCRPLPSSVDLEPWTRQGILLMNTVLTVREGQAASHQKRGWESFTDAAISAISAREKPAVFLLWGSHAQKKKALIDSTRHVILESPHPSPLSAYRGFFGSKPFTKINNALQSKGLPPVDWTL